MTDTQATPRPWRTEQARVAAGKPGNMLIVAYMGVQGNHRQTTNQPISLSEANANAALIVRAVNAYDAMREALEAAKLHAHRECVRRRASGADYHTPTCRKITAALAAAEGKADA